MRLVTDLGKPDIRWERECTGTVMVAKLRLWSGALSLRAAWQKDTRAHGVTSALGACRGCALLGLLRVRSSGGSAPAHEALAWVPLPPLQRSRSAVALRQCCVPRLFSVTTWMEKRDKRLRCGPRAQTQAESSMTEPAATPESDARAFLSRGGGGNGRGFLHGWASLHLLCLKTLPSM